MNDQVDEKPVEQEVKVPVQGTDEACPKPEGAGEVVEEKTY